MPSHAPCFITINFNLATELCSRGHILSYPTCKFKWIFLIQMDLRLVELGLPYHLALQKKTCFLARFRLKTCCAMF